MNARLQNRNLKNLIVKLAFRLKIYINMLFATPQTFYFSKIQPCKGTHTDQLISTGKALYHAT